MKPLIHKLVLMAVGQMLPESSALTALARRASNTYILANILALLSVGCVGFCLYVSYRLMALYGVSEITTLLILAGSLLAVLCIGFWLYGRAFHTQNHNEKALPMNATNTHSSPTRLSQETDHNSPSSLAELSETTAYAFLDGFFSEEPLKSGRKPHQSSTDFTSHNTENTSLNLVKND